MYKASGEGPLLEKEISSIVLEGGEAQSCSIYFVAGKGRAEVKVNMPKVSNQNTYGIIFLSQPWSLLHWNIARLDLKHLYYESHMWLSVLMLVHNCGNGESVAIK